MRPVELGGPSGNSDDTRGWEARDGAGISRCRPRWVRPQSPLGFGETGHVDGPRVTLSESTQ